MLASRYVLSLDAGRSKLTAATSRLDASGDVSTTAVVTRSDGGIDMVAVITDDGDAVFGDDATLLAAARPERTIRGFLRDVGDAVPLNAGGFSVRAEELVARLMAEVITDVAEREGGRPDVVAVTHPTAWNAHRIDALRAALASYADHDVVMIPGAVAAAAQRMSEATPPGVEPTIAVYDLGGTSIEISVLRGRRVLGTWAGDAGGADVDDALLKRVRDTVAGPDGAGVPDGDLAPLRQAVVRAKEALSFEADTVIPVVRDGEAGTMRFTRSELEDLADGMVQRTLDGLEHVLESTGVDSTLLDEIVLVGGASRMPLVAQRLSERFDRPIAAADEPQSAVARGAALLAGERRSVLAAEAAAAEALVTVQTPAARPAALGAAGRPRSRRLTVPSTTAALVTASVLVAGGVALATTTNLGAGAVTTDDGSSERAEPGGAPSRWAALGYSVPSAAAPRDDGERVDTPTEDEEAAAEDDGAPESPPRAGGRRIADPDDARNQGRVPDHAGPRSPGKPSAPPGKPSAPPGKPTTPPGKPPTPSATPTSPTTTDPTPTADPEPTPSTEPTPDPPADPDPEPTAPADEPPVPAASPSADPGPTAEPASL